MNAPQSAADAAVVPTPFKTSTGFKLAMLALVVYAVYAMGQLGFSWGRFVTGLDNGAVFLGRMFPPRFTHMDQLERGIIESLEMAVLSTFFGVLLALPIAILGARNLMPVWVTWPVRIVVTLCRAFNPVIVGIIFIKAVGFGALAGILALMVSAIGFVGKLFMEAIEEISMKQIEAVRATGAGFMSVVAYGVIPQVFSRLVGFCSYQFDANLRNSTMIGIVGAGGVGSTLFNAYQRFEYDFVLAILISIILIVLAGEMLSILVKRIFDV
ncbi:MAG: phosphonate ABC transporter, permease protein PhnE [Methylobacteriaceae bacterium]|jgi:phosphonate transport system permease protein|nr:phosphonate ABC transporter, permease protein PhnE [Methylobacteriaceae bacterium]